MSSEGRDSRLAVGLIGLGNMGTAIAERLLASGCDLVVHNRTPEKAEPLRERGANVAGTAGELAASVDLVLTSLADDAALESVAADVTSAARPGTVLVDLSTVSPAVSSRVGVLAEDAGALYLRAPVSGNPSVVRSGDLTFIVSGPPEALERAEPVLLTIGRAIHRVGEEEQARVVKLAINLVVGGLAELMAEALVLSEASGVSRSALLETLGDSAAGAPFVRYKTEPLLRDDYSATFTTRLMEKDVDLVLEEAASAGVSLPLAGEIKRLIRAAVDAGYGDDDFMALFLSLRDPSTEAVLP
ncbi:MAG TPA: NAD(P)-dependent oxidoreductase [Gaiellaceae bacterium]|nr:NAD(P)-dependent oxidoreductase [Gaiellaceae bacterium]